MAEPMVLGPPVTRAQDLWMAVMVGPEGSVVVSAMDSAKPFHRHFKSATALSPVQFQKRIRLLQARLLLVSGGLKASDVAFDVGYESATQFSREYARFFAAPPAKDAMRISRSRAAQRWPRSWF